MANVSFLRRSPDGKWLHCPQCSRAYWGAFRPTDFVRAKFDAHTARAHKAQDAEAGDEPAVAVLPAKPAKAARAPRPAPRARNAAKIAKIAAKAEAKGDGPVQAGRVATAELQVLEGAVLDALADIHLELHPRLQGGQGPRDFPEEGGDRVRQGVRNFNARRAAA